jgi:hypothetical protein
LHKLTIARTKCLSASHAHSSLIFRLKAQTLMRLQGVVPTEYGTLRYLRELKLGHNKLSGTLGDFEGDIPLNSLLYKLELQDNLLSGTLYYPNLVKMAVFASSNFDTQSAKEQEHVFNVENNNLEGPIGSKLLQVRSELLHCTTQQYCSCVRNCLVHS